jgi:hypothetical protein
MHAGHVNNARNRHILENRISNRIVISKPASINPLTAIHAIVPYESNAFSKASDLNKRAVEDEKNCLASLSKKAFVVTSKDVSSRQDVFIHQEYQATASLDEMTRDSLKDPSKFLHGSFHTTVGKNKLVVKEPNTADIQKWVKQLYDAIVSDWNHLRFTIQFTAGNELLLLFQNESLPPANALVNYMNQLSLHGIAGQLGFTRRGDRWYVLENNMLVFAFYSPGTNLGPLKVFKTVSAHNRTKAAKKRESARS